MSPNEAQLRAALRDGEGNRVDVDAVVASALRVRHARRQRLSAIAGAVIVVAGVAGGAALLGRGDHNSTTASSGERSVPSFSATSDRSAQPPAAAGGSDSAATAIRCPAQLPRLLRPGGGATATFGGGGALFAAPIAAAKVCAYLNGTGGDSQVLDATQATELAASVERAPASRGTRLCPNSTTGNDPPAFVIFAVTAAGKRLPVVTATLGCPGLVTNGSAIRYNWSPPSSVSALITERAASRPTGRATS